MSARYDYTPLTSLPDDTIRLLQVLPGHPGERIRCHLSTAQLTLRPKFAALSYVWGTELASEEIELNCKQFWIRKNLLQCLIRLREPTRPITIWIDAICVNQEDIPERNQQVKFMNHIFGTAKPVFAWLGNNFGDVCATLLQDVDQFSHLCNDGMVDKLCNGLSTAASDNETVIRLSQALARLYKTPYWNRVWIVQEILVAQILILCFDDQRIAWEDFKACCDSLTHIHRGDWGSDSEVYRAIAGWADDVQREYSVRTFLTNKRGYRSGGESEARPRFLNQLISTYGWANCSDPKDRVYALLGLREYRYVHRLRDRKPLEADYKKSRADLFFDVIMFEGMPDPSFGLELCKRLELKMEELEQHCLLRKGDTFSSRMKVEARVHMVLFGKVDEHASSQRPQHSQVVLIKSEDEFKTTKENDAPSEEFVLVFATGTNPVKHGDFVFKTQYSSVYFVFRYRRAYFRPIARLQRFMPKLTKAAKQKSGSTSTAHKVSTSILLPKEVYAPRIDFEIWNGVQELEYGPNVLLEIMKHAGAHNTHGLDGLTDSHI